MVATQADDRRQLAAPDERPVFRVPDANAAIVVTRDNAITCGGPCGRSHAANGRSIVVMQALAGRHFEQRDRVVVGHCDEHPVR
jgi:hypothetical protein